MEFDQDDLLMSASEARIVLQARLESLLDCPEDLPSLQEWHQKTKEVIEAVYANGAGRYFDNNSGFAFVIRMHEGKRLTRPNRAKDEGILQRLIDNLRENSSEKNLILVDENQTSSNEIFVVHGHDETMISMVARTIQKLGLSPIILREQPNRGATLIEKFENYASVKSAIVLMTGDDIGGKYGEVIENIDLKRRARQNVILEFGYFVGKLGRQSVCVLKSDDVEAPSDILGVIYTPIDESGKWQFELARELKAAGDSISADSIL